MRTFSNIMSIVCGLVLATYGLYIMGCVGLNYERYTATAILVYETIGLSIAFLGGCVPFVSWEGKNEKK